MSPKRAALMLALAVLLMAGGFALGRASVPEVEVTMTTAPPTTSPTTTAPPPTTAPETTTPPDSGMTANQDAAYDFEWAWEVFEGGDYFSPDTIEPVTHKMAWYLAQLGTVEVTLHCYWGRMLDDDFGRLNIYAIEIRDLRSDFYQRIDNISTRIRFYGFYDEGFNRTFTLGDWNMDGHVDFSMLVQEGGTMRNTPSYFWLWDEKQNCFVENDELCEISSGATLVVDKSDPPRLMSYWREGPAKRWHVYYDYVNGHFVEVESQEWSWEEQDDGSWLEIVTTSHLIGDEWVVVDETREPYEN